jgi:hypothetical protein
VKRVFDENGRREIVPSSTVDGRRRKRNDVLVKRGVGEFL